MSETTKLKLPKPELFEGEVDFPEMIKKDFHKAVLILSLTALSTIILVGALWALAFFL
ncbi:MAG: hypothetical protein HZR80_11530 [Candidatus Heimdallarchaeota archaeon]